MKKALRFVAVAVLGLSLTSGVASAATGQSSIHTTGPNSYNEASSHVRRHVDVRTDNNVRAHNNNDQFAQSGTAIVSNNTNAGEADTDEAVNDNWTMSDVRVRNSDTTSAAMDRCGGCGMGGWEASIDTTGPNSDNIVDFSHREDVRIHKMNNVRVHNDSVQTAVSGDAIVTNNTNAGSARTGNVTNVNTTETHVEIEN